MHPRRFALGVAALAAFAAALPRPVPAQWLLVPMDDQQSNHLKAYGLTYGALKAGLKGEWLLNYRGGSFLLPDVSELRRRAGLDGVMVLAIDNGTLAQIRGEIAGANMDAIPLEKAPKIAVYTPPNAPA